MHALDVVPLFNQALELKQRVAVCERQAGQVGEAPPQHLRPDAPRFPSRRRETHVQIVTDPLPNARTHHLTYARFPCLRFPFLIVFSVDLPPLAWQGKSAKVSMLLILLLASIRSAATWHEQLSLTILCAAKVQSRLPGTGPTGGHRVIAAGPAMEVACYSSVRLSCSADITSVLPDLLPVLPTVAERLSS